MTAAKALKDALNKYDGDAFYGQQYQDPKLVITAARALLNALRVRQYNESEKEYLGRITSEMLESEFLVEYEDEGGQTNGAGEVEPNDEREWYTEARESHHRARLIITGPWHEGPTPEVADQRRKEAERQAALAEQLAAQREAEIPAEEDEILRQADEIRARRAATDRDRHDTQGYKTRREMRNGH